MQKRLGSALCLAALLWPMAAKAQGVQVVAVFEIDDSTKRDKKVMSALTDYFRVKLAEGGFKVVDKGEQEAQLKKIIAAEKKNSYKTCVDESCQIPLGKELAADRILRGKLNRFGKAFVLSAEMVDLASGASTGAASDKSDGSEEGLMGSVERIAGQLVGKMPAPVAVTTPPPPAQVSIAPPPPAPPPPNVGGSATKPVAQETSGLALTMIIGGWSVFAAGYFGEIIYTLAATDGVYLYYAFFPLIGPILVASGESAISSGFGEVSSGDGNEVIHYGFAALQVVGAGVAVIGHILALDSSNSSAQNHVDSSEATVNLMVGPGMVGLSGRF